MNFKKITTVLIFTVMMWSFLTGCAKPVEVAKVKQVIEISTQAIHNDDNTGYISKSAKVQGSSEIIISSQVAGRIQSVPRRIGDRVSQWSLVANIQDTNNTYNSVRNAELALERARFSEQNTRADIAKQQEKISYDLNNINATITGSSTQIQLAKLEQDLEKAELDYQARLKSDNQTNENLITSAKNIQTDLQIILSDTVDETDKLLWITDKYLNDTLYKDMRVYLSAKNITTKDTALTTFTVLQSLNNKLKTLKSADINDANVSDYLKQYQAVVVWLNDHFVIMKQVFIDTIEDARFKNQVATSQGLFAGLQAKASGLNASITAQLNSIRSYFATYQDNQDSLARQIDSLRSQIALTKKSLDDAAFNTNLWAERTEIGFDNQTKNTNLNTQSAELSLQQARFQVSKFTVTTPIDGSVADVLVDVGQDVNPGTPLIKIVSPQQQIETNLTVEEMKNITIWQKVVVTSDIGTAEWTITSISQIADKSGSFKTTIALKNSTVPTGSSVRLKIPVQQGTVVLPINTLSIVDENTAVANFWDTKLNTVVSKRITIETIFGDQVEISDPLSMNYELILTDLSNYDPNTMDIKKL